MMNQLSPTIKGLITGGAMIAATLVAYFGFKIPFNSSEQFVTLSLYTAGIIWALVVFKKQNNEPASFKMFFQEGFKVFIVVTLLMVVYSFFYYLFDHSQRDAMIENTNKLLLEQKERMPSEIAENAKQIKKMFLPMMVGICLFKHLIIGVLITAITGGFLISQQKD
ncbi:MAG: DUF4199 domain-containing protein [Bacteroidetes bacterium]|nr:DUF4199 domain-containing protein [Bacteroidota bacterium]